MVKVVQYGVRGLTNSWFSSFLKKTQYVYLDGDCSIVKQVTCGVPQDSTLGPLLFLVYINDLQGAFPKLMIHHFAGDTKLLFLAKKLSTLQSVINYGLNFYHSGYETIN